MIKNNNANLIAVTTIAVISIIAVTVLLIFSPENKDFIQLLGFAGLMITQLINNRQVSTEIKEVHEAVNSKMSMLIEAKKQEGIREGEDSERAKVR